MCVTLVCVNDREKTEIIQWKFSLLAALKPRILCFPWHERSKIPFFFFPVGQTLTSDKGKLLSRTLVWPWVLSGKDPLFPDWPHISYSHLILQGCFSLSHELPEDRWNFLPTMSFYLEIFFPKGHDRSCEMSPGLFSLGIRQNLVQCLLCRFYFIMFINILNR